MISTSRWEKGRCVVSIMNTIECALNTIIATNSISTVYIHTRIGIGHVYIHYSAYRVR